MQNIEKPVIEQIETLVADVPGWSPVDQLYTLYTLAVASSGVPGDILEIGSWCGRSACVLAKAVRASRTSKVMCLDLFPEKDDWHANPDGTHSFRVRLRDGAYTAYVDQTVWQEPYERDIVPFYSRVSGLRDVFDETIQRKGFADIVVAHRATSEWLRSGPERRHSFRLAFIDGDHSYDAVCADILNVLPFLMPGGWICLDDAFTTYEGVSRAAHKHLIGNPEFDFCQQMTRKLFIARKRVE